MKLVRFNDRQSIYRVGDATDRAFVLRSGKVVVERDGAAPVTLDAGEAFGAGRLISVGERCEAARADGDAVVVSFRRAEILQGLDEPEILAASLHALLAAHEPDDSCVETALPRLVLLPNGKRIRNRIGAGGVEIERLPFTVGREDGAAGAAAADSADLELADVKPFQLSRRHFSIQMRETGPVVRDTGSHHGTVVNGSRIGERCGGAIIAPLKPGENHVEAGGSKTPFRFIVVVGPPA